MAPISSSITVRPGPADALGAVVTVLMKYGNDDYYAYERRGVWHLGLGTKESLLVDCKGETATLCKDGKLEHRQVQGSLANIARDFVFNHSSNSGKVFGHVGFNYAAHVRGQSYKPGRWPLLALMVPRSEITVHPDSVTVTSYDSDQARQLCDLITGPASLGPHRQMAVDVRDKASEYCDRVNNSLSEIANGQYTKVIASRVVSLKGEVNMPATLLHGRRSNTPARTFSLRHAGFQATGFSPELVALVEDGKVITEPLAGTRSRVGTDVEVENLRKELLHDYKEIVEHVLSVQEAIQELQRLCPPDTVAVEDLMSVRSRGSVQHLGSRVSGRLSPDKDGWDALDVLFPSITASGIPKQNALEAIQRLEDQPRELYSGAVLMLEGPDLFEATLVLRTVFKDESRQWIQAGAGIISQSNAERELTETCEKMSSFAPYIMANAA